MSFLGKIGKFLKKAVVSVGRTALASATGGASEPAIRAARALAVNMKAQKIRKIEPLSVRAVLAKSAPPKAATRIDPTPLTMPGGAPLRGKTRSAPKKRRMKKAKATRTSSGTKRKAPGGGLDLKAIAAMWRAQGKPGKWIDFIKKNPIRKAG